MTEESSQTGGPSGPTLTSELLRMIDSQLSILTGIQENLMAGQQWVTLSTKELHGLKRLVEDGTFTINTTKEPFNKPQESISKEDSSMSSSLLHQDIPGAENQVPLGTIGYDSSGNPYWSYSGHKDPLNAPTFLETYRKFLNNLPKSPKTT